MIDPLTRLAILHGTDKFGMHDYTPVYHAYFAALRDLPLRLLEIGVGGYGDPKRGGRSLAMWRDYFPHAQIVGFDISEKQLDLGPRVTILQGSQIDADFLKRLVEDHGPFDIIIDDGSHHNAHVWRSFQLLMPALTPGGIYIVEDVQTAFFADFGGSLNLTPPNILRSFGELMLDLPQGRLRKPDWPQISRIDRQHNMIVVATAPSRTAVERLSPDGAGVALAMGRAALWGGEALAPPRILPADPALWLDETALSDALQGLADGEALALHGWPGDTSLLLELFAQIDHVERAVAFPHIAPIQPAGQVIQMSAFVDGILLVRGPNDFPSNMSFRFDSRRARTAFEQMYAVLSDPLTTPRPTADSVRMLISVLRQVDGMPVTLPLVRRLAQIGASDGSSVRWAVEAAVECHVWADAVAVAGHAHAARPECPVRCALLAWCLLRRDGDQQSVRDLLALPPETGRTEMVLSMLLRVERARAATPDLEVPVAAMRLDLLQRLRDAAHTRLTDLSPANALVAGQAGDAPHGDAPVMESAD